ncbi:MAG: hypothetical protein NTU98_01965 [Bacteroidetes bacterium]|nr:hypothetical protein [Bacteroidota bacterium]
MNKITFGERLRQFYYVTVANQSLKAGKNGLTMVHVPKQDFTDENGHFIKKPGPKTLTV